MVTDTVRGVYKIRVESTVHVIYGFMPIWGAGGGGGDGAVPPRVTQRERERSHKLFGFNRRFKET